MFKEWILSLNNKEEAQKTKDRKKVVTSMENILCDNFIFSTPKGKLRHNNCAMSDYTQKVRMLSQIWMFISFGVKTNFAYMWKALLVQPKSKGFHK